MLYCDAVTDAMIKGLGEQKASVRYNILTNSMDVAFLYMLLPIWGIAGYFVSFTVTHVINYILSLRRLLKITGIHISLSTPIRAVMSVCLAILIAGFATTAVMQIVCSIILLSCLLYLSGVIRNTDLPWLLHLIKGKDRPV